MSPPFTSSFLAKPATSQLPSAAAAAAAAMASTSRPSLLDVVALKAAADGELCVLKKLAEKVNLHEAKDPSGHGLLHFAAGKGHLEVCRFLVEELGLDVNSMSVQGDLPVHSAAALGNESVLRYLLGHGGDPGVLDSEGTSLLHHAVMAGNCETVRVLLSMGVDVDTPCYRGTPLLLAAIKDRVQVVKILLEHGADPNKVVGHVYPPLMMACLGHSLKSMKLLVKAGADVNFVVPSGRSILAEAIRVFDDVLIDIVKFLLEAGADPNLADKDGEIPIMYAAVKEHRELVEILLPNTRPVPSVPDWSVDGIITSAKDLFFDVNDAAMVEERIADAKSKGKEAFAKGEYLAAVYFYALAIDKDPSDATLFANMSLCWLRLRDGDQALSDAELCILKRPHWSKAWYRQGAALTFLKDYKGAVNAFNQAQKLDPRSDEIKKALREAIAGMEGAAASMEQGNP